MRKRRATRLRVLRTNSQTDGGLVLSLAPGTGSHCACKGISPSLHLRQQTSPINKAAPPQNYNNISVSFSHSDVVILGVSVSAAHKKDLDEQSCLKVSLVLTLLVSGLLIRSILTNQISSCKICVFLRTVSPLMTNSAQQDLIAYAALWNESLRCFHAFRRSCRQFLIWLLIFIEKNRCLHTFFFFCRTAFSKRSANT